MHACALAIVAIVATDGCGAQTNQGTRPQRHLAGTRYSLLTHCGIEWAKINGTFWRATRPLSDGHGNPPAGWGNPFQAGRLALIGRDTARFSSSAGGVTFKRTPRVNPPVICS